MSGRRSQVRFEILQSPEGVLRVMRDVVVQRADDQEFIAISGEPGVLGEAVTVDVLAAEAFVSVPARVVDSQPVVLNGSLRHRLRLEATGTAS